MDLRAGKVKPPYKPVVAGPDDTRNIDTLFLNEKIKETPDQSMTGSEKTKTNFKGFTYNQDELLKKGKWVNIDLWHLKIKLYRMKSLVFRHKPEDALWSTRTILSNDSTIPTKGLSKTLEIVEL